MIVSNSYVIDGDGVIVIEGLHGFTDETVQVTMQQPIPPGLGLDKDGTGNTLPGDRTQWIDTVLSDGGYTMTVVVPDVNGTVTVQWSRDGISGRYPSGRNTVTHVFPEITLNAVSRPPTWSGSGWDVPSDDTPGALDTQYVLEYIDNQDVLVFTALGYPVYFNQLFVHGTLVVDGEAVGHAVGNRVLTADVLMPDSDSGRPQVHSDTTYIFYKTVFAGSVPATDYMYLMFQIDGTVFRKRVNWNGERFTGPSPLGMVGIEWSNVLFDHFGRGNGDL